MVVARALIRSCQVVRRAATTGGSTAGGKKSWLVSLASASAAVALLTIVDDEDNNNNTVRTGCEFFRHPESPAPFEQSPMSPSSSSLLRRFSKDKNGKNEKDGNLPMNKKYNIDWSNVLGEGAYGKVHLARVAATGEKVALKKISKRFTNSSAFTTETAALWRI